MGGIGAGMICLEGAGALTNVSVRNRPDLKNEPLLFGAIGFRDAPQLARVLEGPVPGWKLFPGGSVAAGGVSPHGGYPRFKSASFKARFPFCQVSLADEDIPFTVEITGWSPFEPGDADHACLPLAAVEYTFTNRDSESIDATFSFHAQNFMAGAGVFDQPKKASMNGVRAAPGGYVLCGTSHPEDPWDAGALSICTDDPSVKVDHAWPVTDGGVLWTRMWALWRQIERAASFDRAPLEDGSPAPGASLYVPFTLPAGESRTIALRLAWYVPGSRLRTGDVAAASANATVDTSQETYRPWYTSRFSSIDEVASYWARHYRELKEKSRRFSECLYDSTLPPEVMEAVAANLTILKSPTVLRQSDGRVWGWEGCFDSEGWCPGSCTHVWNFAQALPHLFPTLERSLRETEFGDSQRADGYQAFRAAMPIRPPDPASDELPAADGQLGGIMKLHRDWRISGDLEWLRGLWPRARASLDYCIRKWDPHRKGRIEEPQHVGFDVWLWGPNGMTMSHYVGALKAASVMGHALGENVSEYETLLNSAIRELQTELFDGEYFYQQTVWRGLQAKFPDYAKGAGAASSWMGTEFREIAAKEGPHQQYGKGCLANGINGAWMAWACGVEDILDVAKVKSHLQAVYRHNFKRDLSNNFNPCRTAFACGSEAGVLICTWPKGGMPTIPLMYAAETWTGVEYEIASHLTARGMIEEGLDIVRAVRARHDGRVRNPFDEMEAGHWYARAMASYALLQALSGARYDAVDRVLYLKPAIAGDFRCFFSASGGYGTVGVQDGRPFLKVVAGAIPYRRVDYVPCRTTGCGAASSS